MADDNPLPSAIADVIKERHRQITEEHRTAERDDTYLHGELARAAGWYALASVRFAPGATSPHRLPLFEDESYGWPWALPWFKPKDRRADLVRAGALILAEIERLDRNASRSAGPGSAP